MASIIKIGKRWRAQIRRKGFPDATQTFDTKARAQEWASKTEADMRALKYQDERIISDMTLSTLIDRYTDEIGQTKPFGKNKAAVLKSLKIALGDLTLPNLTADRLIDHIKARSAATLTKKAAGGVTIAVELSYLGSVLKVAKQLWRLPVNADFISQARANMHYLGLSTKSKERDRRPTQEEIERLCAFFDAKGKRQKVPMSDLIRFATATAMRAGEIINLKWADLNEEDRTIIIRDRKHPQEKKGNDQEVPLLGDAFAIVKRQPKTDDERIFPVTDGTISSIFPRACNALKIIDLRFHDLRHEGVSRLFEQGYRIEQVALVSGHRDWKMLARYTQIRAKDLHRSVVSNSQL